MDHARLSAAARADVDGTFELLASSGPHPGYDMNLRDIAHDLIG